MKNSRVDHIRVMNRRERRGWLAAIAAAAALAALLGIDLPDRASNGAYAANSAMDARGEDGNALQHEPGDAPARRAP